MSSNKWQKTAGDLFLHWGRMLSSGVPLIKALEVMASDEETPKNGQKLLNSIRYFLEYGQTVTDTFRTMKIFPESFIAAIEEAEKAGHLDSVMIQLGKEISEGIITVGNLEKAMALPESDDPQKLLLPIVKLVNKMIINAVEAGASDLHIDPDFGESRVRFRIDGVLQTQPLKLTRQQHLAVMSRIKIMANLDPAEQKKPQDGRILIRLPKGKDTLRQMDLRISVCPFVKGEKLVIRFLDKENFPQKLESIRMTPEQLEMVRKWMQTSHGMILVSGPTGSGKTTTLYLMLQELAAKDSINVVSVEDPVEYLLPGTYQMQIQPGIGLTYAAAIRSVLRQDPDVVSVGEIQEAETAKLLAQVAQCGHLTLTQLHASNAVAAIKLMVDLGVPVYTLREIIIGASSQRLLRSLCPHCKAPMSAEEEKLLPTEYQGWSETIYTAKGCEKCHQTGYLGRSMIIELLEPDQRFWAALSQGATADVLLTLLPEDFPDLRSDGLRLVKEGKTTLSEVNRVIG